MSNRGSNIKNGKPSSDEIDNQHLSRYNMLLGGTGFLAAAALSLTATVTTALAQQSAAPTGGKPNIILILSDDFGYGDAGAYLGGEARGMPTPNIDRLAAEGMTFLTFYAQPSCTPGRAAVQTGRIPNRSGMTTVAFQGQGGGLPAAEWTLGVDAQGHRLQNLLYRQMASRRSRLRATQRARVRRDEVCRPLSPQRLYLR